MFLISGVCLSKFSLVNYRREIIGVCLSDLKLVIDFESLIRGMFFQFEISEILGVYEDVGYVFLGVYLSLCRVFCQWEMIVHICTESEQLKTK